MGISKSAKKVDSRLEIIAPLFRRCCTYREIQSEVMARLNLKSYSLSTVKDDIERLLDRWREQEISDVNDRVNLELVRIDEAVRELWEQWEKSKEDYKKTSNKRKGKPLEAKNKETGIRTIEREIQETEMRCLGDVSYIAEIRAQLAERRKLLGLYASEKSEIMHGLISPPSKVVVEFVDFSNNTDGENNTDSGTSG
ncbi:MAG: hypothetical protein LBK58_12315 [Prevotellaceae bacterium]|jgi:hypothetical protein|nr:hypothetical protein [Prevotellaceae bacterium]